MNQQQAKKIADYIFKEVFQRDPIYSLDKYRKKFAFDIPLPSEETCALSGKPTWSFSAESNKIASQEAIADRFKEDEWMQKKESINSMEDLLRRWQKINYITGEKYINSKEVNRSDGVYHSAFVYQSVSIFDSKNIIFSYKIFDCNYLLASRDDSSCVLGIRTKESLNCSSCFEVSWSAKVSRSMFIHDCFDLYECLFCFHIRSKRYCVANMQFEKEEYLRIKKMVIDWILKD